MWIISRRALEDFWTQPGRDDAETPLRTWYAIASQADWKTPSDIRAAYGSASFPGNDRVVFNIAGNKYRLIVLFRPPKLYIRFIDTHAKYDQIDASKV